MEHAPTLGALSRNNLWFENAFAPAPWTLPSHASLLSGTYPHEHRTVRPGQSFSSCPLLESLDGSYRTYGISGNPFFSPHTNTDEFFDEFYFTTPTLFADGLDVVGMYETLSDSRDGGPGTRVDTVTTLARKVLAHDHPIKSLGNVLSVTTLPHLKRTPLLNRIPHPRLNDHDTFSYSPKRNTERIERVVRSHADTEDPFFVVANYMDTHRPYAPPKKYQRRHLGRTLSYRELDAIDKELADTWTHLERIQHEDIPAAELETLQGLYAGTVNSADEHLRRVLEILEEAGLRDETLLIVTSDHGEALGERDEMGQRRVGHQMTVSDSVLRVPLVISHPDIDPQRVTETVSLKDVFRLLAGDLTEPFTNQRVVDDLRPDSGIAVCEYPAKGIEGVYEKHPSISREVLRSEVSEHTVTAHRDGWKLVKTSDGTEWTGRDGERCAPAELPRDLHEVCDRYLAKLRADPGGPALDDRSIDQLESLGYL